MQIACPVCFARFALEAGRLDADARRAVALLGGFEGVPAGLLVEYLGLFRTPARGLPWRRAARLLEELAEVWRAGAVRRRGRDWPLTPGAWREGLEAVAARGRSGGLDLPLRRHAYLYEVLAHAADRAGAEEERRREEALRSAPRRGGGPRPVGAGIPAPAPGGADSGQSPEAAREEVRAWLARRGRGAER